MTTLRRSLRLAFPLLLLLTTAGCPTLRLPSGTGQKASAVPDQADFPSLVKPRVTPAPGTISSATSSATASPSPAATPTATPSVAPTVAPIVAPTPTPTVAPTAGPALSAVEASLASLGSNSWGAFTPMTSPRQGLVAAAAEDRLYAIGGDGTFTDEYFEFATGRWARFTSSLRYMGDNLYFMGGVTVATQTIVLGGIAGKEGAPCSEGMVLPLETGMPPRAPSAYLALPNSVSLYGMGMAALNGKVYVAGGRSKDVVGSGHYVFTDLTPPDANNPGSLSRLASSLVSLTYPRAGLGLAAAAGKLYAIGGYTMATLAEVLTAQNTVQVYTPGASSWIATGDNGGPAAMPTKRFNFGTAVVNDRIYVMGGIDDQGRCLRTVEIYDPTSNQWSIGAPMPTARSALSLVVQQGRIFALGGVEASGRACRVVEVYAP